MTSNLRRVAYFSLAPLVCLLLFWRVFQIWFLNDDFAWLGLPLSVHNAHQLWRTLFLPQAQGTIRVLSERLYFLVFSTLFGFNAVFYRIWNMATWFVDLALAAAIGARLTRSRAAGLLSAMLWTSSVAVIRALAWAAAYDQLLVALCLLSAFYSRLRWLESAEHSRDAHKWKLLEWLAYLAGFGALETVVMYPLLAALYGWCIRRPKVRDIAVLCLPAAAFTLFHLFGLPPDPSYPIVVDGRMPANFLHYLTWTLGPGLLGNFPGHVHGHRYGLLGVATLTTGLALFVVRSAQRRDFIPVFFCGWFALLLAPVLPLPNNVQDYYLTVPALGLAWLGGAALASRWRAIWTSDWRRGWPTRVLGLALLALYLPGTLRHIDESMHWFLDRTSRLRVVFKGLRDASRSQPGEAFVLSGVDENLYDAGFEDDPFRLLRLSQIYVTDPVGTFTIAPRFRASTGQILGWIETDKARVLSVSPQELTDITADYAKRLQSAGASAQHPFIDTGDPAYASLLGPGWYAPEQGFRWMPKQATVILSGSGKQLIVTGYAPALLFQAGPVKLTIKNVGSAIIQKPDEMFYLEFALPPDLASTELTLEVNHTTHAPGDPRELGLIVKTIELR